jgi:hypothetical protein
MNAFALFFLYIFHSLGPLVKKVQENQLQQIVDSLCGYISQDKEDLREIASIGLKTVIVQVPVNSVVAVNVCKRLVPRLLSQLESVGVFMSPMLYPC